MLLAGKNISEDGLNIALMVISLLLSIVLPFELFLFSYAILGPLHYLTEINWLHEKKYFVKVNYRWIWLLIVVGILIAVFSILSFLSGDLPPGLAKYAKLFNRKLASSFFLFAFFSAFGMALLRKKQDLILWLLLALLLSVLLSIGMTKRATIILAAFLPTLIHVYLFTMLFMLFGVLKSPQNTWGIFAVILLILCPVCIIIWPIDPSQYVISAQTNASFMASSFQNLIAAVAFTLGKIQLLGGNLRSEFAIRIQMFIAFAYTYHYLNWFAKTTLIGWRKVLNFRKTILLGFVWLFSIALYLYDYRVGLLALFTLSLLHVFLEFPLNALTIKTLIQASYKRLVS
jgi:hypothetical protein